MTPSVESIRAIETAAADALPCKVLEADDGWRLRFEDGVTRRGNSVLAEQGGRDRLAAKIERAEAFYLSYGKVPRFQLTDASLPVGLRTTLAGKGYSAQRGALVQTADLSALPESGEAAIGRVRWAPFASSRWLEALGLGSGESAASLTIRAENLAAVSPPKVFLELDVNDTVAAVGFAVAAGRYLGLFNLATVPSQRRRGAGGRVLRAAAAWGRERGAREVYLQVHPDNVAAQALYASFGFTTHHTYDYWEAPS